MHQAVTGMLFVLQKMSRDCCLWLLAVTWVLLLVTTGEPDLPFLTAFLPAHYAGSETWGGNPHAGQQRWEHGIEMRARARSCISWDLDLTRASPAKGQQGS